MGTLDIDIVGSLLEVDLNDRILPLMGVDSVLSRFKSPRGGFECLTDQAQSCAYDIGSGSASVDPAFNVEGGAPWVVEDEVHDPLHCKGEVQRAFGFAFAIWTNMGHHSILSESISIRTLRDLVLDT